MKTFIICVCILYMFLLNSCCFFRSIGLYDVPPDYADTFKEINGIKFIDHPNKTSNLVLELSATQKEFSPYDSIRLNIKIYNTNPNDTMYIHEFHKSYYNRDLIVTDSLNYKIKIIEWPKYPEGVNIVDAYGRKIKPTYAPYGVKLAPKDSLVAIISFKTGNKITPKRYTRLSQIERENIPGTFKVFYIQEHEEYDITKGPIPTEIRTPTVVFQVRKYTQEELTIRNKAVEIVNTIEESGDFSFTDSLLSVFKAKHPESIYYDQMITFLELKKSLVK